MEFIGIGDLHLSKMDKLIPNASSVIAKAIERVFKYAIDRGVHAILFYGDICETPRMSYADHMALIALFLNPKYCDLDFHFILGNHDWAEDGTHSLQVLELITRLANVKFTVYTVATKTVIEGEKFLFLPYPHKDTSKLSINVGHFEVSGSTRDNGRQIDEGVGVPTSHQTVMGHLHTNHRVKNVHYSGTLYQTNFGESEEKFFHHCSVVNNVLKVKNVPFKSPWHLVNLKVIKPEDLKEINGTSLYKLFLKDGLDIDLEALLKKHPNIVKTNVFKTKQELQLMVSEGWKLDQDLVEQHVGGVDELKLVEDYLTSRFSNSQVKRGLEILERLRA